MGGPIAIKYVVWFKLNVFRVASITKDHKDDDDQHYLGGPVPPLAPSWAHHWIQSSRFVEVLNVHSPFKLLRHQRSRSRYH